MSAVGQTVPLSLETDSNADASDEFCGVPTPDKEKERYTIARLEGRLDQMSPEAKATQETERAASRNGHSQSRLVATKTGCHNMRYSR